MVLYRLYSISSIAFCGFSPSSKYSRIRMERNLQLNPAHGYLIHSTFSDKHGKTKEKTSRASMSDEELCKKLREVMLLARLPADRVPLTKELCEHGSDYADSQAKMMKISEDLAFDMAITGRIRTEIDQLKAILHQKGIELAELKQHIEKEKQALTMLQEKAQTEIGSVHRILLAKEADLSAATNLLSGLKEVEVQFSVNGETVEVSGSFNGWHKQIKMDLIPTFAAVDSQGSSASKLWSTYLWLYPGTYEIKFIVDGQWKIDPQREKATAGDITNNILRIDR